MTALPWNELSKSAQAALSDLVVLLAGRYTGVIEIHSIEGGVREFKQITTRQAGDLGTLGKP